MAVGLEASLLDIRDLARHLNISIGTVSRAINGRSGVSAKTRDRVLEAAARLNYAPNQSGRALRKGTTHAVAFVLQPHPGDHQQGEPFFVPFMRGMQAEFEAHGLELLAVMDRPGGDQERLRRVVEARWADAIVLAWTRRVDKRIEYLKEVGFPFATLGRSTSGGADHPSIDLDFVDAGARAVDRLAALGHRRIGVIGPSTELNFSYLFRQGCRRGLARNGLTAPRDLFATCEASEAGGYAATKKLMEVADPPTAILYNNDAIAIGGCRALGDLGLKPGRDIAIIVTVGSPFCRYLSPALTNFGVRLEPLGRRLAQLLLASMPEHAGPEGPRILQEVWPLDLIPGETDSVRSGVVDETPTAAPIAVGSER
jgi:DNA-binding LacI/PurR family transcriptional regulator